MHLFKKPFIAQLLDPPFLTSSSDFFCSPNRETVPHPTIRISMSGMMTELEERFKELSNTKTVRGVLILNGDGAPVKSSLDPKATEAYANVLHEVTASARKLFLELDPSNELTFARFRFRKSMEVMVAPDKQYLLVVIYHPNEHQQ